MTTDLVVRVSEGYRLKVDTSEAVGRMLVTSGIWEPAVTTAFRDLLAPGDVCVDVGAHVGYYTLLASRLVGPDGHVYALEPAPGPFEALLSNLELNGASNVTALPVAAGAADGMGVLEVASQSVQSAMQSPADLPPAAESAAALSVRVRPVWAVVPDADLPRVRLVKIDVEGYELEVLRGLEPIYEAARPSVLVEIHHAEDAAPLVAELCRKYGLKAYRIDDEGEDRLAPRAHAPRELTPPLALPHEHHNLLLNADRSLPDVLLTAPGALRRLRPALSTAFVAAALLIAWFVKAVTLHDYDLI